MSTKTHLVSIPGAGRLLVRYGRAVTILLSALLVSLGSPKVYAQTEEGEPSETVVLSPEIEAATSLYQACVNSVMSTLEFSAVKRQQIAEKCGQQRTNMINAFPADFQPLIETNTDRRIAAVLDALEQIENAVVESAEDVAEIAAELSALEGTTSN